MSLQEKNHGILSKCHRGQIKLMALKKVLKIHNGDKVFFQDCYREKKQ